VGGIDDDLLDGGPGTDDCDASLGTNTQTNCET
jgi:hypothetical protein